MVDSPGAFGEWPDTTPIRTCVSDDHRIVEYRANYSVAISVDSSNFPGPTPTNPVPFIDPVQLALCSPIASLTLDGLVLMTSTPTQDTSIGPHVALFTLTGTYIVPLDVPGNHILAITVRGGGAYCSASVI
jgi:hypothetical protein